MLIQRQSRRRRRQLEKAECDAEEIACLVVKAHERLPKNKAKLRGLIYARYSSDMQQSIIDQVREVLLFATENGIFVSHDLIFWDSGITGRKKSRPSIDAAKEALVSNIADVWLSFNSSRVYRRGYQCMKFVVEDIVGEGKRCICVKNGIDTATSDSWHALLAIMSFVDEVISKLTTPNILAAHLGLFANGVIHGCVTYGYCGEPIPGVFNKKELPRRKYQISEAEAKWVRQIFDWYVLDRLPVREIVRRLNATAEVPLPRLNIDDRFTRDSVVSVLGNPRYRGNWSYGRTQNVWNAKKDYGRAVLRDQPLATKQFEHLRIVTDDIWYAA
ncbi:MAG: recombinase family protein [Gemmatales bacterium]